MTTVNKMIAILKLLEQAGMGEETIESDHDVIFLPIHDEHPVHDDFENRLTEAGAFYSDEYSCWIVFT